MKKHKTSGFTLAELIVVITILAILGTIAFISLQGYTRDARDGVRIADLTNIETALGIYTVQKGQFPEPTNGTNITYSGGTVWTQGTLGDSVALNLGTLSKKPVDPLTETEYAYSVTKNRGEYQLGALSEGGSIALNLPGLNQTVAATKVSAIVKGNYNGKLASTSTGGTEYILAVPSILATDTTSSTDLSSIISNNKMVFEGRENIPASYASSSEIFELEGGFDYSPTTTIEVFAGNLDDLRYGAQVPDVLTKLANAYSGTTLAGHTDYQNIENSDFKLLTNAGVADAKFATDCTTLKTKRGQLGDGLARFKDKNGTLSDSYCAMDESLYLDFTKDTAFLSGSRVDLKSLFTVTRSSSGTYENNDGTITTFGPNELRYGDKGLLVEEERTNLVKYSQNSLGLGNWAQGVGPFTNFTFTDNYALAPDGTQTAVRIQREASHSQDGMTLYLPSLTIPSGQELYYTFWAKSLNGNFATIWRTLYPTVVRNIIITDEWKKFSYPVPDVPGHYFPLYHLPDDDPIDLLVWGFQIEQGSFATSFIPTEGSMVTREADSVKFSNLSWINSIKGTFGLETNKLNASTSNTRMLSSNTYWAFIYNINKGRLGSYHSSINIPGINTTPKTINNNLHSGFSWNSVGRSLAVEGQQVTTDNVIVSSLDYINIYIGSRIGVYGFTSGYYRKLTYWPTRKKDSILQKITTP